MIRRRPTSLIGAPTGRPRRQPPQRQSPWTRLLWGTTFVVVGVALFWVLRPVLAVLAASAALAYLLDPVVDWFEARRIKRETAIVFIFASFIVLVAVTMLLLVPSFARQAQALGQRFAPFVQDLDKTLAPLLAWFNEKTGRGVTLDLQELQTRAPAWVAEAWPKLQDHVMLVGRGLFTQGLGVISAILNVALTPIFVFYLLRDWDRLLSAIAQQIPPRHRPRVIRVAHQVDQRLNAFVRGQITVCLILAVLYSAGLLIVGIDLAIPVGTMAGLLFIVPYLGTVVGIVLGVMLALIKFGVGLEVLWVLVVFGVVQGIEGWLLTPHIVGDKVGLHPLVVMIALIVGGSLMGIWGMLLAIPITAVLSVLASEWLTLYRKSRAFGAE